MATQQQEYKAEKTTSKLLSVALLASVNFYYKICRNPTVRTKMDFWTEKEVIFPKQLSWAVSRLYLLCKSLFLEIVSAHCYEDYIRLLFSNVLNFG